MSWEYQWRVNFCLRLNLSHYFGTQSVDNGFRKLELCLSLEAQELLLESLLELEDLPWEEVLRF